MSDRIFDEQPPAAGRTAPFVSDRRRSLETEAPRVSGSRRSMSRGHVSNAVGVYVE